MKKGGEGYKKIWKTGFITWEKFENQNEKNKVTVMQESSVVLPYGNAHYVVSEGTYIHPSAVIGENVTIGKGCYIGPFCLIGFPAEWKGHEHEDMGVIICDGARLTGHVTVDAGVINRTVIGNNSYLMKHSHVGHDAVIGGCVTISCGVKVGGCCNVQYKANIGLNAVIHQKQNIAEGCMIGMGSVITRKLITEPYRKYAGNPARDIGENIDPFKPITVKFDHL